ncbi:uncharacterized protein EI97DRAFT_432846 [Westerdykella ornata]|uniref:RanBP2-type domain-containing protein n=1 Tax=Westerdykella ornata TaxID=318751 RepID=A0A6A6JKS0_WESOR|nr:uncharacterized protein EI97DRAFT_432846 [Westerdykella ornata]KAF2277250.1 hypothetical protein EI97DRAFT_432846 [Westerdykella ornata]
MLRHWKGGMVYLHLLDSCSDIFMNFTVFVPSPILSTCFEYSFAGPNVTLAVTRMTLDNLSSFTLLVHKYSLAAAYRLRYTSQTRSPTTNSYTEYTTRILRQSDFATYTSTLLFPVIDNSTSTQYLLKMGRSAWYCCVCGVTNVGLRRKCWLCAHRLCWRCGYPGLSVDCTVSGSTKPALQ